MADAEPLAPFRWVRAVMVTLASIIFYYLVVGLVLVGVLLTCGAEGLDVTLAVATMLGGFAAGTMSGVLAQRNPALHALCVAFVPAVLQLWDIASTAHSEAIPALSAQLATLIVGALAGVLVGRGRRRV